jgi:hypothetical protein
MTDAAPITYRVYAIKLRKSILRNRRFKKANPEYRRGKPCVYVGSTSLSAEERFARHMTGRRSSRVVRNYGKTLFPWAYEREPTFDTRPEAEAHEMALAARYRAMGWGVWQN